MERHGKRTGEGGERGKHEMEECRESPLASILRRLSGRDLAPD